MFVQRPVELSQPRVTWS